MFSCFHFFFLLSFFFFLGFWLLAVTLSLDEEEGVEKDLPDVESKGSTLIGDPKHVVCCEGAFEAPGAFETTGVENNHTNNPIVIPRRLKVAIMGG